MLRQSRLFLLMGLIMLAPALARAQDDEIPPLTETYTAINYDLDFQYPADWEVIGESAISIMFSAPIGGTGLPTESGVAVEGGGTVVFWTFEESGTSAEDTARSAAEDFVEDGTGVFELSEPQHLTINGRTAAQIDALSMVFLQRYISMEIDDGMLVTVELIGFEEGVIRATPIVLDMLATLRPSGAPLPESPPVVTPALTQNHMREADQTSFSIPAGWLIEERDNYTLLTAPNGVTVGISSELVIDSEDLVLDTIALIADNLMRQLPDAEIGEVEEFEMNSRRAARVAGMESQTYFGFWALDLGGDMVGHISVIGPPDDARELEPILFAIAETITSGQAEDIPQSGEPLALTEIATSGDGAFELRYPQGWEALPNGNTIMLINTADLEFEDGELAIMVQNSLAFLSSEIALELPENVDVATVARAIARAAQENDAQHTIEKLSVNDRTASLLYGADGDQGSFILIFELSDGTLASLLAGTSNGELEGLRSFLVAIAETVSPR